MNEWGELKGEKVKNDVGVLMGGNEMRGSSYIQCEGFGGEDDRGLKYNGGCEKTTARYVPIVKGEIMIIIKWDND